MKFHSGRFLHQDFQIIAACDSNHFLRVLLAVAHRPGAQVDTHITALETVDAGISVKRWFYRQRLEATLQRDVRPWFLLVDSGCHDPWTGVAGNASVEPIDVSIPPERKRTVFIGIRTPNSDAPTIRPDAKLLFCRRSGLVQKTSRW